MRRYVCAVLLLSPLILIAGAVLGVGLAALCVVRIVLDLLDGSRS